MDLVSDAQIRQTLQNVFHDIDRNKSGFIDLKEVEEALKRFAASPETSVKWNNPKIALEARHFVEKADKDKDRKVSLAEFLDYYAPRLAK